MVPVRVAVQVAGTVKERVQIILAGNSPAAWSPVKARQGDKLVFVAELFCAHKLLLRARGESSLRKKRGFKPKNDFLYRNRGVRSDHKHSLVITADRKRLRISACVPDKVVCQARLAVKAVKAVERKIRERKEGRKPRGEFAVFKRKARKFKVAFCHLRYRNRSARAKRNAFWNHHFFERIFFREG